jgi:hypothetical protein
MNEPNSGTFPTRIHPFESIKRTMIAGYYESAVVEICSNARLNESINYCSIRKRG